MADIHIDDFFKDAAGALNLLYRRFPQPIQLFVEDLTGPQEVDEFGLPNSRHMACFSTLLWLADEGFLRYVDTVRHEALDQATLTGRCFSALVAPAAGALGNGEAADVPTYVQLQMGSNMYRIQTALKARDSVEVRVAMTDLLSLMRL